MVPWGDHCVGPSNVSHFQLSFLIVQLWSDSSAKRRISFGLLTRSLSKIEVPGCSSARDNTPLRG